MESISMDYSEIRMNQPTINCMIFFVQYFFPFRVYLSNFLHVMLSSITWIRTRFDCSSWIYLFPQLFHSNSFSKKCHWGGTAFVLALHHWRNEIEFENGFAAPLHHLFHDDVGAGHSSVLLYRQWCYRDVCKLLSIWIASIAVGWQRTKS